MPQDPGSSILVVDDDDDVRSLMVLQLQMSGFQVREANTVDGGLAAIDENPPDVVLTDLNFGPDTGERIIRRCQELGQPVLLMTASVETRDLPPEIRESVTILRKPFSMADLADAVRQALAKPSGDRP